MNDTLLVRELKRRRDVAREPEDILLGQRSLARDPRPQTVGTEVHREVDVLERLRDGANADDVRVLELCRRLALVAKPALELGIARVAGLEDLDRDRSPIGRPADERPSKAPLAQEPLQGIGAKCLADEVGSGVTHFTKGCKSVNLRRFQRLGNRDDVR